MGKFLLSTLLLLTTAFALQSQEWIPVTDITEINTTDEYILVCPSLNIVAGTTLSSNRLSGLDVTLNDNKITTLPSGVAKIKFENSSTAEKYKIYISNIESANKYLGGTSSGKISLVSSGVDATLSFSQTSTSIKVGTLNLSGNSGNTKWFALYTNPQKTIFVYKLNNVVTYPTECEEPVFSMNGKEVAKESTTEVFEGNTISVTCPTKDSTIEWGYQLGETKYPLEESKFTIPTDFNVGATYTFYANASCTGENNAKLESSSSIYVTVVKKPNVIYTNKFKKVTDASELEAGAKYVVAYFDENGSKAMSTTASTSDRSATAITITDGVLTATEETLIITLEGETGKWKLNAENYTGTDKYLLFNQTYKTDIRMASASDATEANISITTDGYVEIQAASNGGSRLIKYNGSDSFKYYANSNGSMCQLYRQIVEIAPEAPGDPEFAEEHTEIVNGTLTSEKSEYSLKFKKVEGVDIYYRHILKDNNTTTRAEVVDHSGFTKVEDADYENGIKVTKDHSALEYYAFANGVKSETKTLNVKLDTPTGVAEIEAAGAGEVRWFDMQGREVKGQPENGIYVRVVNGKASKVIL